jgi:hypothetical protein
MTITPLCGRVHARTTRGGIEQRSSKTGMLKGPCGTAEDRPNTPGEGCNSNNSRMSRSSGGYDSYICVLMQDIFHMRLLRMCPTVHSSPQTTHDSPGRRTRGAWICPLKSRGHMCARALAQCARALAQYVSSCCIGVLILYGGMLGHGHARYLALTHVSTHYKCVLDTGHIHPSLLGTLLNFLHTCLNSTRCLRKRSWGTSSSATAAAAALLFLTCVHPAHSASAPASTRPAESAPTPPRGQQHRAHAAAAATGRDPLTGQPLPVRDEFAPVAPQAAAAAAHPTPTTQDPPRETRLVARAPYATYMLTYADVC